jgi:hypothetical protein
MKFSVMAKAVLGTLVFSIVIWAGVAQAGTKCTKGTVVEAGVYPFLVGDLQVKYEFKIKCETFDSDPIFQPTEGWTGDTRSFIVLESNTNAESLYAAALTALSSGNSCSMVLADSKAFSILRMLKVSDGSI